LVKQETQKRFEATLRSGPKTLPQPRKEKPKVRKVSRKESEPVMVDFADDVRAILSTAGCYFVRHGKGDHDIWYSPITKERFPVDAKIRSRRTANGIMKQAGLPKQF
jgi:HicA toxin of bacterial toxin-antitoxin,